MKMQNSNFQSYQELTLHAVGIIDICWLKMPYKRIWFFKMVKKWNIAYRKRTDNKNINQNYTHSPFGQLDTYYFFDNFLDFLTNLRFMKRKVQAWINSDLRIASLYIYDALMNRQMNGIIGNHEKRNRILPKSSWKQPLHFLLWYKLSQIVYWISWA